MNKIYHLNNLYKRLIRVKDPEVAAKMVMELQEDGMPIDEIVVSLMTEHDMYIKERIMGYFNNPYQINSPTRRWFVNRLV